MVVRKGKNLLGQNVRGISFLIPNEYGKWLVNILKPIDFKKYNWSIGSGEEYKYQDNDLIRLFPDDVSILRGAELFKIIDTAEPQYIIFADLKAFPIGTNSFDINTYEDFLASDCELILLIVDSVYTSIYCKDLKTLSQLYANVATLKVDSLTYITDENDFRNTLRVW
ncbi:DUF2691 family protein [Paenibacillus allorhizosphaerae]|uniref:DUF2691 family protein n=1 Tax=Paenibacillus allorhizosphaerae TaxID=2849866 RepID=A0ABM8VTV1_9BACL|nr:DUF2691 family protein [Paenibacillus allorhizosphaerae]CAG7658299.1 hypothetical protein PAECIP111802_07011 [Paenibacillus allorhizosphaerae]